MLPFHLRLYDVRKDSLRLLGPQLHLKHLIEQLPVFLPPSSLKNVRDGIPNTLDVPAIAEIHKTVYN